MGMEVQIHFETLILLSLLYNCLSCGPDRRVVLLGWVQVHSVEIAAHRVQSIVASGHAVRIQNHDDFEDKVAPQCPTLVVAYAVTQAD